MSENEGRRLMRCECGSEWWKVEAVNVDYDTLAVIGNTEPSECAKCGASCDRRAVDVMLEQELPELFDR